MKSNLAKLLNGHKNKIELEVIIGEILDFMMKYDWRGACHESCGVQYVLLNELGIECEWKIGEVSYKQLSLDDQIICFDHSWILIDSEIFDIALFKTNYPSLDSFPTIRNLNLRTLKEPDVIYNTRTGCSEGNDALNIKKIPLSVYFNNSPLHQKLGTWFFIQQIGYKLGLKINIDELRLKYNGIFWN